jgi:hypothetical protein
MTVTGESGHLPQNPAIGPNDKNIRKTLAQHQELTRTT